MKIYWVANYQFFLFFKNILSHNFWFIQILSGKYTGIKFEKLILISVSFLLNYEKKKRKTGNNEAAKDRSYQMIQQISEINLHLKNSSTNRHHLMRNSGWKIYSLDLYTYICFSIRVRTTPVDFFSPLFISFFFLCYVKKITIYFRVADFSSTRNELNIPERSKFKFSPTNVFFFCGQKLNKIYTKYIRLYVCNVTRR